MGVQLVLLERTCTGRQSVSDFFLHSRDDCLSALLNLFDEFAKVFFFDLKIRGKLCSFKDFLKKKILSRLSQ